MATPEGYIAELGEDMFRHRFGGQSWKIQDSNSVYGGPTLLLVLDLADPRLAPLRISRCNGLPLCSYINCSIWDGKQVFQIIPESRSVMLVYREIETPEPLPADIALPNPLPEKCIRLRKMYPWEYPVDAEMYYKAFDEFTGPSFIRVLGPPLWVWPISETCSCRSPMEYIASIGYEIESAGFVDSGEFFIGEGYLYFLLCRSCLKIAVISQGT